MSLIITTFEISWKKLSKLFQKYRMYPDRFKSGWPIATSCTASHFQKLS